MEKERFGKCKAISGESKLKRLFSFLGILHKTKKTPDFAHAHRLKTKQRNNVYTFKVSYYFPYVDVFSSFPQFI